MFVNDYNLMIFAYVIKFLRLQAIVMKGYISHSMHVMVPYIIDKQVWRWEKPCDEKIIVMVHKVNHCASQHVETLSA